MSIKRKSTEQEWLKGFINPKYSWDYINEKAHKTVKDIQAVTEGKKVAMAWSGGKDSIALQHIMDATGMTYKSFIVLSEMEYPEFLDWIDLNKPDGLENVIIPIGYEWLSKHEHMLFPRDSNINAKWYQIIQHKGQKKYAEDNGIDVMILGRRKADGNYVGRGDNKYQKKSESFIRYSPIADWTHEEILSLLHYRLVDLPPIYDYPNGFRNGTHPIGARPNTETDEQAFSELHEIDPNIVKDMAQYIPSAKSYLERLGEA